MLYRKKENNNKRYYLRFVDTRKYEFIYIVACICVSFVLNAVFGCIDNNVIGGMYRDCRWICNGP